MKEPTMRNPKELKIAIILITTGVLGLFAVNMVAYPDIFSYRGYTLDPSGFQSNGERIYFTSTSGSGEPIIASMGTMTMHSTRMTCASCHGANGKGGSGRMMMWTFEAPDVRYSTLTTEGHGEHEDEPPYTDELIKRAITRGLGPEGNRLDPPMPVWQMSDEDLDDLIEFLKTLE